MKSFALLGDTALRSSAAVGIALALAAPSYAQTASVPSDAANSAAASAITPPAAEQTPTVDNDTAIIVTGSRINAPNLTSTVPITSISGQQFFQTSQTSVGDVLNELPSIRSTFSTQNSTRFLGTSGLNLIDLRGLGTPRTLVLVNGRRQVGSDILNNAVSPDINTIPTDLIDRVDIITGGDSAVYGSDAIAGVVNFILKDHYDGIEAHAQGGISTYKDGGAYYGSLLAGKNFAGGRGNIAVNLEYARQSDYYGSDRNPYANTRGWVITDTDPAGSVNGSDGVPDRTFYNNIRSTTLSNGGLVSFASPTGACGRDTNSGAAFACKFVFQPDGSLIPETGTRVGIAPNGSYIGGNGDNFREGKQLVLQPKQDRYSVNALGHFDISDAFVPFFEAKYVRINTTGSTSGPAFYQGSTLDANLERVRLDNPYLSTQARTLITNQLIATGRDPATITGATRVSLARNLLDLGVRNESSRRETYRIVGGLRGEITPHLKYEVSGNYGVFKEATRVEGNLNVQRFLLAQDTGRNAAGQIVCRSQISAANGAGAAAATGDSLNRLAADIAACVPLNPFGLGNISSAARNYVIQDTTSYGKITQTVAGGSISGDTGGFFNLPGGPVYAVVGGEYRRETNSFTADPLVQAGYTFYNALPTFKPPSFVVKEAYAEVRVPILKDIPFFQELTLAGAGRVADYKGATGTVYAYNGAITYAPIKDIHFRGNYAHSVRAPNLSELYSAAGQNFASNFVDPCSARNIATGSATRAANCRAAGIPASYDYVYVSSLEITSGGNPNLTAEKSRSITGGVVVTPSFVPGLSLTVDYYDIKVSNVISSPDAQTIANNCYDLATNNSFCSLFTRNTTTSGPNGEVMYQILEGSLFAGSLNFAKLRARGVDVELSYRHSFAFGDISSKVNYTHVLERNDFVNQADPSRADRIAGELGDPIDSLNWNLGAKLGKVTLGYQMRWIGKMTLGAYENYFSVQGRPAENADAYPTKYYPNVFYHDARIGIDVTDRFNIYGGVDNVANKLPPFGLTGVSDGGGIYDNRGRFFYAGVVTKF